MSLELFVGLIVAVLVFALIYFNRSSSGLDVNNDGKVDMQDAMAAATKKGGLGGLFGKLFGK